MKLHTAILLAALALPAFSEDKPAAKASEVKITDAQRLEVREMERNYFRAESQVREWTFKGKPDAEKAITEKYQALAATCAKEIEQFDADALTCKPVAAAAAVPAKPEKQ